MALDARRKMMNSWIGALGGVVFWVLLGQFLFYWPWWIFLLIGLTLLTPIQSTIRYFSIETEECPQCHSRLEVHALFCRMCGFKITRVCPKCNTEITSVSRFCQKCGANLYEITPPKENIVIQANIPNVTEYCPSCGQAYQKGTPICSACGNELKR